MELLDKVKYQIEVEFVKLNMPTKIFIDQVIKYRIIDIVHILKLNEVEVCILILVK